MLMKIVREINKSFLGMIMNAYVTCLLLSTATLYSFYTILFQRNRWEIYLFCAAAACAAFLSIMRLIWHTNYGHGLSVSMKKCVYHLDRLKYTNNEFGMDEIQLLKQDFRHYCEAPVTPFSAFTVSTNTMLGAYGTIITYLIVLLQFKVSEKPDSDNTSQINSNATMNSSKI